MRAKECRILLTRICVTARLPYQNYFKCWSGSQLAKYTRFSNKLELELLLAENFFPSHMSTV